MAYVRKVVTASGATAVQVCEKVGGQQEVLAHIGSAHAHLVVVFTALSLSKYLEQTTGTSKNKLIQQLGPLKDSIIRIGPTTHTIKTEIPQQTQQLLHNLKKGY